MIATLETLFDREAQQADVAIEELRSQPAPICLETMLRQEQRACDFREARDRVRDHLEHVTVEYRTATGGLHRERYQLEAGERWRVVERFDGDRCRWVPVGTERLQALVIR